MSAKDRRPDAPSAEPEGVKQERFDAKLEEVLDGMSGAELLAITGLYEVVSEALNNEVLRQIAIDDSHDPDCTCAECYPVEDER